MLDHVRDLDGVVDPSEGYLERLFEIGSPGETMEARAQRLRTRKSILDYVQTDSARLKTKLALDDGVASINYSIDTVSGIVYLFGIARDQDELRRVTNHARDVEYLIRVVSHVWLRGDPRRKRTDKS